VILDRSIPTVPPAAHPLVAIRLAYSACLFEPADSFRFATRRAHARWQRLTVRLAAATMASPFSTRTSHGGEATTRSARSPSQPPAAAYLCTPRLSCSHVVATVAVSPVRQRRPDHPYRVAYLKPIRMSTCFPSSTVASPPISRPPSPISSFCGRHPPPSPASLFLHWQVQEHHPSSQ
jgi:hypothetical protein